MFLSQFASYALITANTRALSHDRYLATALTDFLITAEAFVYGKIFYEKPEARNLFSGLGLALGGVAGSLFSMWLTKHWY